MSVKVRDSSRRHRIDCSIRRALDDTFKVVNVLHTVVLLH